MVVGLGHYEDQNEAFPLDKKTLRTIGIRSLFANCSNNGETASSIGWAWALEPGLKKIHTNSEDYALSMGHNLEYVDAGFYFNSFAMGVTLALEAQKADLETIRSVRTSIAMASKGLGNSVFLGLVLPASVSIASIFASEGNVLGALIVVAINVILSFVLRFALLKYGYRKGIQAAEQLSSQSEKIKKIFQMTGILSIGVLLVYLSQSLNLNLTSTLSTDVTFDVTDSFNAILPGFFLVGTFGLSYFLLAKKNWSLSKCFVLLLCVSLIGAFFGIWSASYSAPIEWPWLS